MKVLKYILIGLGCLIAIFLVLGLIVPKEYTVARTAVIPAPKAVVLSQIKNLKVMDTWTVWSKRDPDIKQEFGGNDGEVGSTLKWESEMSNVGKGMQEVMAITDNSVDLQLTMEGMNPADVNFTLADTADATKVTWTLSGKMPYPWNALGLFMNMDKMVGPDFEAGLEGLKTVAGEAAKNSAGMYEIKEINLEPKIYIAKRATVKFQDVPMFYETNLPALFEALGKAGVQPAGMPSGLYFSWDPQKQETNMAAAIPVAAGTKVPKIAGAEEIKAEGKALLMAYYGPYEKLEQAHMAFEKYMKEKNIEWNNVTIEEYVTDPKSEPDTSKWLTNIYYLVK